MAIALLEQTLIDQARTHQEALAAYYPKHQAGPFSEDDHANYLQHWGALTGLLELAHSKSGLSGEAGEQLRQVEEESAATFRQHFPIETPAPENAVVQASTDVLANLSKCMESQTLNIGMTEQDEGKNMAMIGAISAPRIDQGKA